MRLDFPAKISIFAVVCAVSMFIFNFVTPDTDSKTLVNKYETVTEEERYNWAAEQYENCTYGNKQDVAIMNNCQSIFKEQILLLKVDNHETQGDIQR